MCKTSPVVKDASGNVDFDDYFILERALEDDDEVIYISIYLIDQRRRRGMGFNRSLASPFEQQDSLPPYLVSSASLTLGTARAYAVEEGGFRLKLSMEEGEGGGISRSLGHHGHLELLSACR